MREQTLILQDKIGESGNLKIVAISSLRNSIERFESTKSAGHIINIMSFILLFYFVLRLRVERLQALS